MDFPPKTREQAGHAPPPNGQPPDSQSPTGTHGLMAFASGSAEHSSVSHTGPIPEAGPPEPRSRAGLWTQRAFLVIFVVFCIELGMLLTVLPWQRIWTENSLLLGYPAVRDFLGNNFVRGIASGIGLVDIWIGIWEAIHYRETPEARS
jgi:hypothetical protein